jgi:hypothetical protein
MARECSTNGIDEPLVPAPVRQVGFEHPVHSALKTAISAHYERTANQWAQPRRTG